MITNGLVRNLILLSFASISLFCAAQTSAPKSQTAKKKTATPETAVLPLHELFDADWEYSMRENPTYASFLGDRRWNDKWEDASLANIRKQNEHTEATLKSLAAIDR